MVASVGSSRPAAPAAGPGSSGAPAGHAPWWTTRVPAVLALLSSLLWGVADFVGGVASRRSTPIRTLAVTMPAGLVAIVPVALVVGGDRGDVGVPARDPRQQLEDRDCAERDQLALGEVEAARAEVDGVLDLDDRGSESLGVRHLGPAASLALTNEFHTLDAIMSKSVEELAALVPADFRGEVRRASVAELFPSPATCVADGETVVVLGSLYLVGEVLARLRGHGLPDSWQDRLPPAR